MFHLQIVCRVACVLVALACPALAQEAVPGSLAQPGDTAVLTLRGVGAQIYECKAGTDGKLSWQFREPVASLFRDGQTMGRHYAGPGWELPDGSLLTAKVADRAPGSLPGDIPWLRLEVTGNSGKGQLAGVTAIQRLRTEGGVAAGGCQGAGNFLSVPYSADYVFLQGKK